MQIPKAVNPIADFLGNPSHGWGRRFNSCRAHHLFSDLEETAVLSMEKAWKTWVEISQLGPRGSASGGFETGIGDPSLTPTRVARRLYPFSRQSLRPRRGCRTSIVGGKVLHLVGLVSD
jgi:hypothetical protein